MVREDSRCGGAALSSAENSVNLTGANEAMPELPEVETVRTGLAGVLVGARIVAVDARRSDLRFPLPEHFAERLCGQRIIALDRRAKYLVASLSGGEDLVIHLGMTGRFSVLGATGKHTPGNFAHVSGKHEAHDHVVLHLEDGRRVVYNDARRFGFMLMMSRDERPVHPMFRHLGVEPLSEALTPDYLAARSTGKKANLKSFLMDQHVVAGLGNIYVSEALYRARLSPDRRAATLSDRQGRPTAGAARLVLAIRQVLLDAIAAGGSTLRDYRQANGAVGSYQNAFAVYGREGERCLREGCGGTIRRAVHAGRATFFCSRCQR